MKVALTIWENRISPLFDAACMLLIVDIEKGRICEQRLETIKCESPYLRIGMLNEIGANILVCGGISAFYANLIEAHGIKIIPFTSGDVKDVLDAYISGDIYKTEYRMPGCESANGKLF
jgi:predicted Fe-Mo cluster-binding NifX family protein